MVPVHLAELDSLFNILNKFPFNLVKGDIVCIENKHLVSSEYSGNIYDMSSASKDGVVYPSLDPSIFEVKFPDSDIEGRVVGDF